ncbi:hypothetical protein D917_02501 [Trichinella nativa]|uniref:Uncharacterized protein n=1 Tax=Trichinella nativa TaxID=6335 RepID=A0A1Y3EI12_9BILA|nr:hypothetical protein D917_02501 [Trichinella nativa]
MDDIFYLIWDSYLAACGDISSKHFQLKGVVLCFWERNSVWWRWSAVSCLADSQARRFCRLHCHHSWPRYLSKREDFLRSPPTTTNRLKPDAFWLQ